MIEFNLGLLADNAHVDVSGKLYLLGEFRYIHARKLPARHGQFAVAARWVADLPEVRDKKNTLALEIVDQDGHTVLPRSPEIELQFSPVGPAGRGKVQAQVILQMEGLVLTKPGDHAIHFLVNGDHNGKVPFHVIVQPPDSPPPANAG